MHTTHCRFDQRCCRMARRRKKANLWQRIGGSARLGTERVQSIEDVCSRWSVGWVVAPALLGELEQLWRHSLAWPWQFRALFVLFVSVRKRGGKLKKKIKNKKSARNGSRRNTDDTIKIAFMICCSRSPSHGMRLVISS